MDARRIILRKRDGEELTAEEIEYMVSGLCSGFVPDYQMSAWLMAVVLRGMTERETTALTSSILHSGRVLEPGDLPVPSADKHSTGGVGDKVSLALAPLVASVGVCVPMLSGRALGHTGGTLDKLESIPGFRTNLTLDEFRAQLESVGVCIAAQSPEMAPADGRIYALRDVTGTVESVPLIVSSIVGKKVAEGAGTLIYDVKRGCGAFMESDEEALALAEALVAQTCRFGRKAMAFVTDMDQPLGAAVGNALEVQEAFEILHGRGPADLVEIVMLLGSAMLVLAGAAGDESEARRLLRQSVRSGQALQKARELVTAQGGDARVVEEPSSVEVSGPAEVVLSAEEGFVGWIETRELGFLVCEMGGGRTKAGASIDHGVGVVLLKKTGDRVEKGEPLMKLYLRGDPRKEELAEKAKAMFAVSPDPPKQRPLVSWTVTEGGRELHARDSGGPS